MLQLEALLSGLSSASVGVVHAVQIGVCRYTHTGNRGIAYALLYSALNFGGALAGFVIDILKTHSVLFYGFTVTGYRLVLFSSLITAIVRQKIYIFSLQVVSKELSATCVQSRC